MCLVLDIPLENSGEFRSPRDALVHPISGLGGQFIEVATNLRQTKWFAKAEWGGSLTALSRQV